MVHENEDFSRPRAPHLGQGPWLDGLSSQLPSTTSSKPLPSWNSVAPRTTSGLLANNCNKEDILEDNASLTSFQTCPSDPNLANLVPRQVSDNYLPHQVPLPVVVTSKQPPATASQSRPTLNNSENVIGGIKHLARDNFRWSIAAGGLILNFWVTLPPIWFTACLQNSVNSQNVLKKTQKSTIYTHPPPTTAPILWIFFIAHHYLPARPPVWIQNLLPDFRSFRRRFKYRPAIIS